LDQPVFDYDLGDPESYLAGERIMAALPAVPEWEPVLGADLGIANPAPEPNALASRVSAQGLQPLRLPGNWPPDTRTAMLVATFAKRGGRAVAYSLAAFRQAFAGGNDLSDESTVLIAAAACEMHPTAVLKGIGLRSVAQGLAVANDRARGAGVAALPAIEAGGALFTGADAVEAAAAALEARR
jgi:2-hydroxychromene-2-carboxylate isomerase